LTPERHTGGADQAGLTPAGWAVGQTVGAEDSQRRWP